MPAYAAPAPTGSAEIDPALAAHMQRENDYNDAFKKEVERMVQERLLTERLAAKEAEEAAPPPPGGVAAQCSFEDAAGLLNSLGLPQYIDGFEREAMDPPTLVEVLQQQGKAALDDALKELGVKSMGHRLKIINSMVIA